MASEYFSSFSKRFWHFVEVTSPTTLIYSDKQVLEAKNIIDNFNKTNIKCGDDAQMQHYQRLVNAAIHPVTGEVIPLPFRVSAIAPVNIPLVFAMLACPPSNVPVTLFLHWFNQSYNTACNYANRSGADQSLESTMQAYLLATTSACSIAYGMGKLATNGPLKKYGVIIPGVATAIASCSNLFFTRMDEITTGTAMRDELGNEYGPSKIAGFAGVYQTAITRCILVPFACLFLPPLGMSTLKKFKILPKSPSSALILELLMIYLSLQIALPAAFSVFPQTAEFNVNQLENNFHNLFDSNNKPIMKLYANKGL